jgi:signal transduction histidine kinase
MNNPAITDLDVVVLAPFGKDSALIEKVLSRSGIRARAVAGAPALVAAIPHGAGAAIICEEALLEQDIAGLGHLLESQPAWSDFPIVVLTGGGMSTAQTELAVRGRAPLGNVTLLERPLRAATMVSAVRSALTARRRQYEIRDHLRQRELAEGALRDSHDKLESIVQERTAALRRLSAQLISVQDEERRRIARELHDGLGQYLAAAKISVDTLAITRPECESLLTDVEQLLDRAIKETRTLSHLLHPPLLDAAGFASAASWYVEGFGNRSGIQASLHLPEHLGRLRVSVETALFRIMQEALTNVHRHSESTRVEIQMEIDGEFATIAIRDFGKGIPKHTLKQFKESGTNVGVGLAGIRERVKELGGTLEILSSREGTTLKASLPLTDKVNNVFAGPSFSQIYSSFAT